MRHIKVSPHEAAPVHWESIRNPKTNITTLMAMKTAVKYRFMLTPQRRYLDSQVK